MGIPQSLSSGRNSPPLWMVGVQVITRSPPHGLVGALSSLLAALIAVRLVIISAATIHLKTPQSQTKKHEFTENNDMNEQERCY